MKKHEQGGGHHGHNPFDIFAQMFGGGSQGSQEKRGPEVNVDLEVSLKDLYVGRQLEVLVRKQVLCKQCGGSGAKNAQDVQRCNACGGSGVKVVRQQVGSAVLVFIYLFLNPFEEKQLKLASTIITGNY